MRAEDADPTDGRALTCPCCRVSRASSDSSHSSLGGPLASVGPPATTPVEEPSFPARSVEATMSPKSTGTRSPFAAFLTSCHFHGAAR
jgi:hypothetical protein